MGNRIAQWFGRGKEERRGGMVARVHVKTNYVGEERRPVPEFVEVRNEKYRTVSVAESLRAAYLFFRRLIDALRMAHGTADDLTLPPVGSDELTSLARRLQLPKLVRSL